MSLTSSGFALSLDALLALALVIGILTFGRLMVFDSQSTGNISQLQTLQRGDDVFTTLYNSGFLLDKLDSSGFYDSTAEEIRLKMQEMLPSNMDFKIAIRSYGVDFEQCKVGQTFDDCFPDTDIITAGGAPSNDAEVLHGRRMFVKEEPPGECDTENYSSGISPLRRPGILSFAGEGDEMSLSVDIDYDGYGNDEDLECDEDVSVTLGITANGPGERDPVDVMIVMDRSGSMGDYTMFDMNVLTGQFGGSGTSNCSCWSNWFCTYGLFGCQWEYYNWEELGTFVIESEDSFTASLKYSGASGSPPPALKLISPSDVEYGGTGPDVEIDYPAETGIWTAWGWSDEEIDYNVSKYFKKLDVAKDGSQYFVDLAEWQNQDQLGLVSFNQSATLDEPLTNDFDAVKDAIEAMNEGGNTATGDGIYEATGELINGTNANPDAMKFQVLLGDGKSNTGSSSSSAAQNAADNGIIIYTIGFGEDVKDDGGEAELKMIAETTGGEYYYAEDEDALKAFYELISQQIGTSAAGGNPMDNVVVTLPVPTGMIVIDEGQDGYFLDGVGDDDNFLIFTLGDFDYYEEWADTYVAVFPCSNNENCEIAEKTFPSEGSTIEYTDKDDTDQSAPWDVTVTVNFLYRDLTVEIIKGTIIGKNEVYLDVNAQNIGFLDTGGTTIEFYLDYSGGDGEFLGSVDVDAFCGGAGENCEDNFQIFYDVYLNKEGLISAIINEGMEIGDCPNNNEDKINCTDGAETQYFTFDYWMWFK